MIRRAEAVARWGKIAAGNIDDETRVWLAGVAADLLQANDLTNTDDKRLAITKAVGFVGKSDASLLLAIRQVVAGLPDLEQQRLAVRVLRNDLPQCRISTRAIDLQIKRAREANSAAAQK